MDKDENSEIIENMEDVQNLYEPVEISEGVESLEKYLETGAELGALKRQMTNRNRPNSQRPNSDLSRRHQ